MGRVNAVISAARGWKGISNTLGKGLKTVEPTFWESELDAAVADRILILPETAIATPAKPQEQGLLKGDSAAHIYRIDPQAAT